MRISCDNKKVYTSIKHANFDSRRIREKYNTNAESYVCEYCHNIHVGSNADGGFDDKLKYFKRKKRTMLEVVIDA